MRQPAHKTSGIPADGFIPRYVMCFAVLVALLVIPAILGA